MIKMVLETYLQMKCKEMEKIEPPWWEINPKDYKCTNCPAVVEDPYYSETGCKIKDVIKMVNDDFNKGAGT